MVIHFVKHSDPLITNLKTSEGSHTKFSNRNFDCATVEMCVMQEQRDKSFAHESELVDKISNNYSNVLSSDSCSCEKWQTRRPKVVFIALTVFFLLSFPVFVRRLGY